MNNLIAGLGILALAVLAAGLVAQLRQSSLVRRLQMQLDAAPAPRDMSSRLPARVRDFALRADATPDDLAASVSFTQIAEMQLKPGDPWQVLDARQTIAAGAVGFLWQARLPWGPVAKFSVIDAYAGGKGLLRAALLGLIPVARADGPDIDRAEAMRYLAELPWAPDAILGNPALIWRMIDDDWAEASMLIAGGRVAVRFRFDSGGDIAEVFAQDRPATAPDGSKASYDWQGYFRDYRMIGPRRVPAEAEVGYVHADGFRPYFQGRITDYAVQH